MMTGKGPSKSFGIYWKWLNAYGLVLSAMMSTVNQMKSKSIRKIAKINTHIIVSEYQMFEISCRMRGSFYRWYQCFLLTRVDMASRFTPVIFGNIFSVTICTKSAQFYTTKYLKYELGQLRANFTTPELGTCVNQVNKLCDNMR